MDILTAEASATCVCTKAITLYRASLRREPFWTHDDTGSDRCGPLAEPVPLSIVRRPSEGEGKTP